MLLNCLGTRFLYIFSMHRRRVRIVSHHVPTLISGRFSIRGNKLRIINSRINCYLWLKIFWALQNWLRVGNFSFIFPFNLVLTIRHLDASFMGADSWILSQKHLWLFLFDQLHWGFTPRWRNSVVFLTKEVGLRFARVYTLVPRRLKFSRHAY